MEFFSAADQVRVNHFRDLPLAYDCRIDYLNRSMSHMLHELNPTERERGVNQSVTGWNREHAKHECRSDANTNGSLDTAESSLKGQYVFPCFPLRAHSTSSERSHHSALLLFAVDTSTDPNRWSLTAIMRLTFSIVASVLAAAATARPRPLSDGSY